MNLSLIGKNALVGGASAGIGRAVAVELALLGAHVTLMARTESALQETVGILDTKQGQQHGYIVADFADSDALLEKVRQWLAQADVHILVNNTGGPPGGPITEASERFCPGLAQPPDLQSVAGAGGATGHEKSRIRAHPEYHQHLGKRAARQPRCFQYDALGSSRLGQNLGQ